MRMHGGAYGAALIIFPRRQTFREILYVGRPGRITIIMKPEPLGKYFVCISSRRDDRMCDFMTAKYTRHEIFKKKNRDDRVPQGKGISHSVTRLLTL